MSVDGNVDREWLPQDLYLHDTREPNRGHSYLNACPHSTSSCNSLENFVLVVPLGVFSLSVRLIQKENVSQSTCIDNIMHSLIDDLLNKRKGNDWWSRFFLFFNFFSHFLLVNVLLLETIKYVDTIEIVLVLKTNRIEYHELKCCVLFKILFMIFACVFCCEF